MNPLTTLLLADSRVDDRLISLRRRTRLAAALAALRSVAAVEPAEVELTGSARRARRAPRWWTALESGETVPGGAEAATIAAGKHATGCTAC